MVNISLRLHMLIENFLPAHIKTCFLISFCSWKSNVTATNSPRKSFKRANIPGRLRDEKVFPRFHAA